MKHFATNMVSPLGEKVRFALTLEQSPAGFHGKMEWGDEQYQVRSLRRDGLGTLSLMLRWLGTFTRTWIHAYTDGPSFTLSIRPLGGEFDYALLNEGFTAFLAFVDDLQVGPADPAPPVPAGSLDQVLDQAVIRQRSVCLYEGSNLQKNLPVRFSACAVDGAAVNVDFPEPLPYELGYYIALGYFEPGRVIVIEWTIQTWNVPEGSSIAIGAFRDGTLAKRTPLAAQKLQPFRTYLGSASLSV